MIGWWMLNRELAQWAAADRTLDLWWRDDGARSTGPALDRLLRVARAYETPLALAVIPDGKLSCLAERLACERLVTVIQHGVDHVNAIGGGPPTEFPPGYPREVIETRLLQARERLEIMPRFAPVFAPPGNQIHPNLTAALRSAGYRGLSAASEEMSCHLGFTRIDVHLDLARGQGGRPFRGADQVLRQLAALASARRLSRQWDQPVGLLTHHLDHGEAAWRFLEALLDRTTGSRAVRWRPINALLSHALNRRSPAPMPVVGGRALQRAARR